MFSIIDNDHYVEDLFELYLKKCGTTAASPASVRFKDTNVFLNIKPCGSSLAMLYFTDENRAVINIPREIEIYTYDSYTYKRVILRPLPKSPRYCLCHTDEYEIEYKNIVIMSMKPQKSWKIM